MKRIMVCGGWVILLSIWMLSCAGRPETVLDRPKPLFLDAWLETQAFDEVLKNLRTNSYLKEKPFVIAKARGEAMGQNISHQIDTLTILIRERLVALLLTYPEIEYVRRHPEPAFNRPYTLQDLSCGRFDEPEMILVIDIVRKGPLHENKADFAFRAMDLTTGNWIPGFSIHQEVHLTPKQTRELNSLQPDEYLIGTQFVPFLETQKAEMGAYLAKSISCIFREGYGGADIKVFVDMARTRRRHKDIVWFMKKQLQFCNEIQLTKEKDTADWILTAEAKETGEKTGIGEFWIDLFEQKNGQLIKGMATYAHFVFNEKKPPSMFGRWEIINLPSQTVAGYLEMTKVIKGGYRAELYNADGRTLREKAIVIEISGNDIEWTYYDDQIQNTVVVNGLINTEREKMTVKTIFFPLTQKPINQILHLVE